MVSKKIIVLATVVVILASLSYFYFFIISPIIPKPELTKPSLAEGQEISSEHIEWVVNELGGYKLQPTAEIELVVNGQSFSVKTKDGKVTSTQETPTDPDVRITADRESFVRILSAEDANTEIIKLYNEGLISVEVLKDEATLALKGYKGIYDTLQG